MAYTLGWKDRFYKLAENMPDSSPLIAHGGEFSFKPLNEGLNELVLKASGQEIAMIFDSVTQGAMLLYPESAQTILEIMLRTIDYAGEIIVNCQDIADCIDNPESPASVSVVNITNETTNNNNNLINTDRTLEPEEPDFIEKRFKSIDRDFPVLPDSGTCDNPRKDEIFGGTLEIVNRLSEMAQDMLEDLNSQADSVQRAARTVALVPLIGDIAGETILAFAEIVPDLLNLYLSHDSIAQHEDVACDLFCLHADDCQYATFQEIIDYYKSLGISGIDDIASVSLQAFMDAIIGTSGLAASVVWHAMNTMVLYFMYAESTFLGRRGTKWLKVYAQNGELVPNNDWMILCECGVQTKVWDFETEASELGWVAQADRANFVLNGWRPEEMYYGNVIVILREFTWPSDLLITQIRVYGDNIGGGASYNYVYGTPYTNETVGAPLPIDGGYQFNANFYHGTKTGIGYEFSIFTDVGQKITRIEADYEGTESPDW